MGWRGPSRGLGLVFFAMAVNECNVAGEQCAWYSVAVDALPANFPTCGNGVTPPRAPDGGDEPSTLQCQSLCAGIAHPDDPTADVVTCCISTWEPNTVVCDEVCQN